MRRKDCTARWKVEPPEKGNHYCSYEQGHDDDQHMCICGATKDRKRRPADADTTGPREEAT